MRDRNIVGDYTSHLTTPSKAVPCPSRLPRLRTLLFTSVQQTHSAQCTPTTPAQTCQSCLLEAATVFRIGGFVFPQGRVCKWLATRKGAPLKFLMFSVACQTVAKGMRFRTGNWNATFSSAYPGCVFSRIIDVAAFSFLSSNKGFRLDEPKDPSSSNFTRSPLEDEEGLLSIERVICYMCSPLKT